MVVVVVDSVGDATGAHCTALIIIIVVIIIIVDKTLSPSNRYSLMH